MRKLVFTLDRDDGIDMDDALLAGQAGHATVQRKNVFTRCPGHHVARINANRFLPGNPFNRLTSDI